MRPRPFLLLLAGFALVLLAAGEADAEREPRWIYETGNYVYSVAISADGEYIAAGSQDDKVYLFDKDSSTPLWSYTTGGIVVSVSISADGEYIAAGSDDGNVYLFDKDSSTPLWSYTTGGIVRSVAISEDGEYIVAGSNDNKVYLFDKDSGTPLWNYTTESDVRSVAISADGEYIAAGDYGKVYLFDKDSSTPLWNYTTGDYVDIAISADGEYIAAGSNGNRVYLFDKDSSTPLWIYTTEGYVESVAISADGEYIAAGSWDDKVYLFDKDSSTPLWNYATGNDVLSVAISADGEYIVAGSDDDKVYLFDKDSSTPLWSYAISGDVYSVAISADGEYIAAGSRDYGTENGHIYLFFNNLPPTATIDSITPSSVRFDAEVTFNGTGSDSDGTVVAYEWTSSRDGFLSNAENFSVTGFSIGTHTISFRVQDNEGDWSEWDTAGLEIYPNALPVGTIDSIEPSPAEKGTTVFFNGTGSDDNGTVVAYLWESSIDGELSTEANFSSNNLSLGHHTITFQVQDNDGDWSDASESLFVFLYPVAIAGADVSTTPNVPIQFNGQGTDEDGTIVKYEWDFDGNGVYDWSSSVNGLTTYIYNNKGTYTVVLRVTDNDGFTDTDTVVITVTEKIIQIDDEGNVTVTDAGEDEEGIPAPSLAAAVATVAVIALRRRR